MIPQTKANQITKAIIQSFSSFVIIFIVLLSIIKAYVANQLQTSRFCLQREKRNIQKCSIFRIFCMLRFRLWWPNRYGKWLFTKKIKFCLVPRDPKIAKKSWKKYVEKEVEKMLKIVKKMLKIGNFQLFFNIFFCIFRVAGN